jgi:hypothetical protein
MEVRAASAYSGALRAAASVRRALNTQSPPETLVLVTRPRDFRADAKQMAQGVYRQRVELFSKVRASGAQHATFPDTAAVLFLTLAAL